MREKFAALEGTVAAQLSSAKVWAISLYVAFASVMLGVMARGFGWL
jgi:hypothetical protein